MPVSISPSTATTDRSGGGSDPIPMIAHRYLRSWIATRIADERGASLIEYALLLVLINSALG